MTVLVVGIDEVATEKQLVSGWTYFVLADPDRMRFEAAVRQLANAGGLRHYHAKKFKKAMAAEYEAFLRLVRNAVEGASDVAALIHSMNETSWKAQFLDLLERSVGGALSRNSIADSQTHQMLQSLFPGLATLQRLFPAGDKHYRFRAEIDQDNVTKALGATSVSVKGATVRAERLLAAAYEGHRRLLFPNSPELDEPVGVQVLSDTKSVMIQAADVVGNFAMAYALHHLGDPSTSRAVKAQVFANVFGDIIDPVTVTSAAVLQGNEMTWRQQGALTLRIEMA